MGITQGRAWLVATAMVWGLAQRAPAQSPPAARADTTIRAPADTTSAVARSGPRRATPIGVSLSGAPQRRAIEHDDAYYRRLAIHRTGSYLMLPLFAGEYLLGQRLLNGSNVPGWVRNAHGTVAGAIGVLFGVNTLTGAMNFWDSRHDPDGTRRVMHSALMLAADAGFLYTATLVGEEGGRNVNQLQRHRNVALMSIGLSTAGTALMWFWRD